MFNNKTNSSIYFLFLFLFISFDLNAIDEFDYNLLSEKINRLEQEISDVQKSLYAPNDNTLVKEDQKPVPLKYQRRINKIENIESVEKISRNNNYNRKNFINKKNNENFKTAGQVCGLTKVKNNCHKQ